MANTKDKNDVDDSRNVPPDRGKAAKSKISKQMGKVIYSPSYFIKEATNKKRVSQTSTPTKKNNPPIKPAPLDPKLLNKFNDKSPTNKESVNKRKDPEKSPNAHTQETHHQANKASKLQRMTPVESSIDGSAESLALSTNDMNDMWDNHLSKEKKEEKSRNMTAQSPRKEQDHTLPPTEIQSQNADHNKVKEHSDTAEKRTPEKGNYFDLLTDKPLSPDTINITKERNDNDTNENVDSNTNEPNVSTPKNDRARGSDEQIVIPETSGKIVPIASGSIETMSTVSNALTNEYESDQINEDTMIQSIETENETTDNENIQNENESENIVILEVEPAHKKILECALDVTDLLKVSLTQDILQDITDINTNYPRSMIIIKVATLKSKLKLLTLVKLGEINIISKVPRTENLNYGVVGPITCPDTTELKERKIRRYKQMLQYNGTPVDSLEWISKRENDGENWNIQNNTFPQTPLYK